MVPLINVSINPSNHPESAKAEGRAKMPAPRIALHKFTTELAGEAVPFTSSDLDKTLGEFGSRGVSTSSRRS